MLHSRYCVLAIVFLFLSNQSAIGQQDSIVSVIKSEFKGDTLYFQESLTKNYYKGNLIYQRKESAIDREWDDFKMTTHFYDLNGKRIKSITIEEDRYECEPEYIVQDPYYNTITPVAPLFDPTTIFVAYDTSGTKTVNPLIIPDSNDVVTKFCGRFFTETLRYLPYMEISAGSFFHDDDDIAYLADTIFYNRYNDIIREVKYGNDKLSREYRYNYVYDEKGRVLEKTWDNLTPGHEFKIYYKYRYVGEKQLQVFGSHHHFTKQAKPNSTKMFYKNNSFRPYKYERYYGDSLEKTHYVYDANKNKGYGFTVSQTDDTTDHSAFERKTSHSKRRNEFWTYRSKNSDKYTYRSVDTIRKKNGYVIENISYRINKEQFDKKERAKKSKNYLLHHTLMEYDDENRLVRDMDYAVYQGPVEYRYEYKTMY